MSSGYADPGHVQYVRRWLDANAERIADAVVQPPPVDRALSGADFVRWLDKLLQHHQSLCQREWERSGAAYHRYQGD